MIRPRDTQMDKLDLEEAQDVRNLDRASYLVDLGIGVFFTIVIAIMVNSQGDALKESLSVGEYSGNAIFIANIWVPLFIVSLLSHLVLHGSPGQYFCKWKAQAKDGEAPGLGRLFLATMLRQLPGVAMVGTDILVSSVTSLSDTATLFIGFFVGMFIWLISLDFSLPYRISGLVLVDRVKLDPVGR